MTASDAKPGTRRGYKRSARNLMIHKPMQREFIFVMILLLMISMSAVAFVVHTTLQEAATGGGFRFGKISPQVILSEVGNDLILRISLVLGIALFIMTLFGLFFLHRVAGPVYRFRQIILRLNEGEIPAPVKLREGDFFQEIAVEINTLVRTFQFEHNRLKVLKEKVQVLAARGGDPLAKEIQQILNQTIE
ncbi:MAG: hypothetical protein HYZ85_01755 [Candidatus Omnitrophica bacterium]|nr:hypothetical protein [Candidatus Omnitrophota bacterium]